MLKAYAFGEFAPDIATNGTSALVTAKNVRAGPNGYGPVKDFAAITPALAAAFKGGAAFIGSDGTSSMLSATAAALYRYSGSAWASVLPVVTSARWRFTQFGDNVICANGGPLISYNLLTGTAAAIPGAPTGTDVATVRDFVFCLKPGGNELAVQWSGFNNSAGWTPGINQSDIQPLLSGGRGVAVIGGEYGLVLQKGAVQRFLYTGAPEIFQRDEISAEIGCMTAGSVASVGKLVFFLSERGFMLCDGNEVRPIGNEKVDRTFFARYSRADIENMSAAVDPRTSLVMFAMPGSPGAIWAYNYALDKWSTIETGLTGIFTGFTSNISIDALDAIYGNLDAVTVSLDDASLAGGNPLLLVANASSAVGSLTGSTMAATLQIANVEPVPGKRARIRALRPVTDAQDMSVTVDARLHSGDAENVISAGVMRGNGKMPIRANGRYNTITQTIAAGEAWSYAQGIEIEFEPGDGR
jgi:hypothetical protein